MWASRRGMLELDLLLQSFVDQHYDSLSEDDKSLFHGLLELEDQQLFLNLVRREESTDPDIQRIVKIIHDSRRQPV